MEAETIMAVATTIITITIDEEVVLTFEICASAAVLGIVPPLTVVKYIGGGCV